MKNNPSIPTPTWDAQFPSASTELMSTRTKLKNLERSIKWEKQKVDKAVNQLILSKAMPIAKTLIDIGLTERNPTVLNSLLDRAFGKASQSMVHEGNPDKPIVFMPAQLLHKYGIPEGDSDTPRIYEDGEVVN